MNIEALIAAANPAPASDLPDGDSPHARRALDQILQLPARARPAAGSQPRSGISGSGTGFRIGGIGSRSRLGLGIGLVGAAAAGTAALVVAGLLAGSPTQPGRRIRPGSHAKVPTTATDLRSLALIASVQRSSGPPGPGQFQYTKSESLTSASTQRGSFYYTVNYQDRRQIWIGSDGSGRIVETQRHPTFPSAHDRAVWIAAGRPSLRVAPGDDKFGPHGLSDGPVNLLKLPTNEARLAALISGRKIEGGPPGPAEDFVQVGDLLRESDAPPALRSALFQVAAGIPGVRVLENVTDHAGRSGVGVVFSTRHRPGYGAGQHFPGQLFQSELIFDPKSSALLAEQAVTVNIRTKTSTVTSWTVYLSAGVVDSITSTPAPTAPGT